MGIIHGRVRVQSHGVGVIMLQMEASRVAYDGYSTCLDEGRVR